VTLFHAIYQSSPFAVSSNASGLKERIQTAKYEQQRERSKHIEKAQACRSVGLVPVPLSEGERDAESRQHKKRKPHHDFEHAMGLTYSPAQAVT
jgi:hypothetical protein